MKLLKDDPVRHDVLDLSAIIVSIERQQEDAKTGQAQRSKGRGEES